MSHIIKIVYISAHLSFIIIKKMSCFTIINEEEEYMSNEEEYTLYREEEECPYMYYEENALNDKILLDQMIAALPEQGNLIFSPQGRDWVPISDYIDGPIEDFDEEWEAWTSTYL